jgi:glutathione S-transferase
MASFPQSIRFDQETPTMRFLYHNWFCPFSRKVRILLSEKGLDFDLKVEKTWERRKEFLAMNPAGATPVLVEDDGTVVAGNYPVTEYLEEVYTTLPLYGHGPGPRAEVRRLTDWFDNKYYTEVNQHLITEKVMKRHLAMGEPDSFALRCASSNIHYHLDYIGYLADRREWLAGDHFSMADITAAAHLSCSDYFGNVPWEAHEDAKNWYMRVKSRRSMRTILNDRIAGLIPPKHYSLLDF